MFWNQSILCITGFESWRELSAYIAGGSCFAPQQVCRVAHEALADEKFSELADEKLSAWPHLCGHRELWLAFFLILWWPMTKNHGGRPIICLRIAVVNSTPARRKQF